ncbi:MAG TPA: hypothetical protein VFH73_21340 [Polyangia bacterium]|nr:hypothetical protein [Polyangia bacterium]
MRTSITGSLALLLVSAVLMGCQDERGPLVPGNNGKGGAQGGSAGSPAPGASGGSAGGGVASGGAAGGGVASGGAPGGGSGSGGAAGSVMDAGGTVDAGACAPADCKFRPVPEIACANGGTPVFTCARTGNGVCNWTMPRCDPNDGGTTPKPDASGAVCTVDSDCRLFDDYCTGCNCRALGKSETDPKCSGPGVRCLVQPCANKVAACKNGQCVVAGQTVAPLTWHNTCGDPQCQGWRPKPNLTECTAAQKMGGACTVKGDSCDPHDDCNRIQVCDDKSQIPERGGCPISRRSTKRDIHYLSTDELRRYHDELLEMKLATWRYKNEPARERLGFILDDKEGSVAVDAPRDMVDLYGYTSLAVATLQLQARELETLRAELEAVHRRLDRLDGPRSRAARK